MRILFAGATGAIGRQLVPMLAAAGHEVYGMTRGEQGAQRLREQGAAAVVGDALDRDDVQRAAAHARPKVVLQQLTALPQKVSRKLMAQGYAQTDRLRAVSTALLMEAAPDARVIAQSVSFVHRPDGGLKTEDDPMYTDAPEPMGTTLRRLEAMERKVVDAGGTVLRYGYFYGPGTWYARDGAYGEMARRRMLAIAGKGEAVNSFCHVEDAASATLAALDGPAGVYQVVDDHPALQRDWVPAFCDAVGAKPPRRMPSWLLRRLAGPVGAYHLLDARGADNARFKQAFGWEPAHASWREGFRTL